MGDGVYIGSEFAVRLGLNRKYFSNAGVRSTLNPDFQITTFKRVTLVRVSPELARMFAKYVANAILDGDAREYKHVVSLTQKTSIGFY